LAFTQGIVVFGEGSREYPQRLTRLRITNPMDHDDEFIDF
jgi:hypothetical protein